MTERISRTQFGFIPTKTAAEANTYLQTIIRWAHRNREPMQIVFLDAKSAFDLTSTEATTKMMRHLGTPKDLIDKINNLTTKGTVRVEMFKKLSAETEILSGTCQGCPGSALKFDINHEGNLLISPTWTFSGP